MTDRTNDGRRAMPPLTEAERHVLLGKGTELPFSGQFWNHTDKGLYHCRACGSPLFHSQDKFDAGCGWPSFDAALPGAVLHRPDSDGKRTEIVCTACGGHLGHVFEGEGLTPRNVRHCVNSISLAFDPARASFDQKSGDSPKKQDAPELAPSVEDAVFAGGCFWGVEQAFRAVPGVKDVISGYAGGDLENPSYREVCAGNTGHAECVRVTYNPAEVSYAHLARLFFEIHDPTQRDGQGPDKGSQYRSAIFYESREQQEVALQLREDLRSRGYDVVTQIAPLTAFYPAEEYHQHFAERHSHVSCQRERVPRF